MLVVARSELSIARYYAVEDVWWRDEEKVC